MLRAHLLPPWLARQRCWSGIHQSLESGFQSARFQKVKERWGPNCRFGWQLGIRCVLPCLLFQKHFCISWLPPRAKKRSLQNWKNIVIPSIWHRYCYSNITPVWKPQQTFSLQSDAITHGNECLQSKGEFHVFQDLQMKSNSSLDAHEELGGKRKKQKIISIGGGFLFFSFHHPCCLLCDRMSLWEMGAFLTGDQIHIFYTVNHSNNLLDSYTNIGV